MSLGQQNNGSWVVEMHGDLTWLIRTDYTRTLSTRYVSVVSDTFQSFVI